MRNRVVLITGGSRGLGLVLARLLHQRGARLALIARDADELARANTELGNSALTIPCDLTDTTELQAAVRRTLDRFGKIDILINNAGIIEVGPLQHMQRTDFERSMQLHFWAPFDLIWLIVPEMRRQGGGRIVNISSIGGKVAVPHLAPYTASKFALTGFSDAIRAELAHDNIFVTTVAPGLMRTGSHVNAMTKGDHDAEFAWFSVANAIPINSTSAAWAARRIIAACRRAQPSLTLTLPARLMIAANAVFPNIVGHAMRLANRLLPSAVDGGGNETRLGWDSRLRGVVPDFLTRLSDRATVRNNEQRSRF